MPPIRSRAALSLVIGQPPQEVTDADLARSLVAGADWALPEVWHRFAPMVLTTAERTLGSKAEAEDLAQEVFCRMLRNAKTLRDPDSLRSFIYSITVRALKSHLRYRRLRAWLSFQSPEQLVDLRHSTLDMESRDLLRKFYTLLDRLTPRARLVFILRRVETMTVEEIAATMDLSTSTVKRSMTQASNRLSRWIDADPGLAQVLDGKRLAR